MLTSAQVVAGTCIGMAGVRGMENVVYDLCIVDEASKATATEILVPMSRSRKWILVGDPAQLPPFFENDSITL
jgi:superfamily I DNA and/or RNA helicase